MDLEVTQAEKGGPPSRSELVSTYVKKVVNSHFTPRFLFNMVINNAQFDALLASAGHPVSLSARIRRRFRRLLYFWPSLVDADSWAKGAKGSYRDPTSFISMWPGVDDLLLEKIIERVSSVDSPVLDLGCSCGRHLVYLHERGLTNLSGVDVMSAALRLFRKRSPTAYERTAIHHDFFQRFLTKCGDNRYDLLYSGGATIELVHPSFDIVRHMCRVTENNIVLTTYENRHNYPRFYVREFAKHGFVLVEGARPIENTEISLLIFQSVRFRDDAQSGEEDRAAGGSKGHASLAAHRP